MDVRAVLRRSRLPFVASLFLAALLGAPTMAGPTLDPLPAPVAVFAAAPATNTTAAEPVAAEPALPLPPAAPADDLPAPSLPDARVLADQASTAAAAPRAPPFSA